MSYKETLKKRTIQHAEHERARKESRFRSEFTFEQITHIAAIAYEGIVPDGTYSDDECALWSALRREFHSFN